MSMPEAMISYNRQDRKSQGLRAGTAGTLAVQSSSSNLLPGGTIRAAGPHRHLRGQGRGR